MEGKVPAPPTWRYLRVVQHGKDSLRVTSASLYRSKSHPVLRKTQENLWCGWHCPGSCEFHVAMGSVSPCPPGQGHSSELGMLQDAAPTHLMPLGLTPLELSHSSVHVFCPFIVPGKDSLPDPPHLHSHTGSSVCVSHALAAPQPPWDRILGVTPFGLSHYIFSG